MRKYRQLNQLLGDCHGMGVHKRIQEINELTDLVKLAHIDASMGLSREDNRDLGHYLLDCLAFNPVDFKIMAQHLRHLRNAVMFVSHPENHFVHAQKRKGILPTNSPRSTQEGEREPHTHSEIPENLFPF
jgi:hypothetical protein